MMISLFFHKATATTPTTTRHWPSTTTSIVWIAALLLPRISQGFITPTITPTARPLSITTTTTTPRFFQTNNIMCTSTTTTTTSSQPTLSSRGQTTNAIRSTTNTTFASSSPTESPPRQRQAADDEPEQQQQPNEQHLILVGGGHAHVQVIKALNAQARPAHLRVTLIDAMASASYSGMVPGCVAGTYQPDETLIHLQPLAQWAGLTFVEDRVVDIDLDQKLVYTRQQVADGAPPLAYDVISLDIGSGSRGLREVPGAAEFTIPTRPIDKLVQRLRRAGHELAEEWGERRRVEQDNNKDEATRQEEAQNDNDNDDQPRLVVIGGGAAGIELSMAVHSQWKSTIPGLDQPNICLLDGNAQLVPHESDAARAQLQDILDDKHIDVVQNCQVTEIDQDYVHVTIGNDQETIVTKKVPYTHCIWATGAGAHPLAWNLGQRRGLDITQHGWIQVKPTLQSTSHRCVFAAGDCAAMRVPKAGVFAVRTGPILIENLTRQLQALREEQQQQQQQQRNGSATANLIPYEPQEDFLKLLVCGDGKALGFRFDLALYGKWVMQMKDQIDQGFMDLFRVDPTTAPRPREENSGDNNTSSVYNTTQYDDTPQERQRAKLVPKDAREAAIIIQRQDDDVNYEQAWAILRRMTKDLAYREQVLRHVKNNSKTDEKSHLHSLSAALHSEIRQHRHSSNSSC